MSKSLIWLPKITHDLYDNVDKIIRDTIDRDPLLFIPIPAWKVHSVKNSVDFMLIKISDIQNISIYLIYRYVMNCANHYISIISHVCITENWWQNGPSYDRYNVRVATINPTDCKIKWILNDNQIIDRVTNSLIKLGLVKWIK